MIFKNVNNFTWIILPTIVFWYTRSSIIIKINHVVQTKTIGNVHVSWFAF